MKLKYIGFNRCLFNYGISSGICYDVKVYFMGYVYEFIGYVIGIIIVGVPENMVCIPQHWCFQSTRMKVATNNQQHSLNRGDLTTQYGDVSTGSSIQLG